MKSIKEKADLAFSRYVRYSAATEGGYSRCYTCAAIDKVTNMDCGHYIDREVIPLRYSEDNTRIQCRKCNRHNNGEIERYGMFLMLDIGRPRVLEMREIRDKYIADPSQFESIDYEQIYKKYSKLGRQIRMKKNF